MSAASDDLSSLKDDMVAFIEGHGMRRFHGYVDFEEVQCVMWKDGQNPESWKDFVEMAKSAGAPMVCIGEDVLDKTTLEMLTTEFQELSDAESFGPEMEKIDRLFLQVGKLGHVELAFAHQGILFVHESATGWYRQYRQMVDMVENLQDILENAYDEDDNEDRD